MVKHFVKGLPEIRTCAGVDTPWLSRKGLVKHTCPSGSKGPRQAMVLHCGSKLATIVAVAILPNFVDVLAYACGQVFAMGPLSVPQKVGDDYVLGQREVAAPFVPLSYGHQPSDVLYSFHLIWDMLV